MTQNHATNVAALLGRRGDVRQKQIAAALGTDPPRISDLLAGRKPFSLEWAARMIRAGWPRAEVERVYLDECRARLDRAVATEVAG